MSPVVALLAAVMMIFGITLVVLAFMLDERRYEPNRSRVGLVMGLIASVMIFVSGGWLLMLQLGGAGTDDGVVFEGAEHVPDDHDGDDGDRDADAGDLDDAEPSTSPDDGASSPQRPAESLEGSDVEVAAALSRERFPDGGAAQVVLVRRGPTVDALVASGLHGLLDAPVLLTDLGELPPETVEEIDRLGTPAVHILGGEMAVSAEVEADLVAAGHDVHRHTGARGVDTAIDVAEQHFADAETAILTSSFGVGSAWQSSGVIAVGSLASARGLPVLLSDRDGLTEATADYLSDSGIRSVVVVGGDEEWRAPVESDLKALGISVTSIGGSDHFTTAAAVAEVNEASGGEAAPVFLLEGSTDATWPGVLVAVTRGSWDRTRIVLSDGDALPGPSRDLVLSLSGSQLDLRCLEGVDEAVCDETRALLD